MLLVGRSFPPCPYLSRYCRETTSFPIRLTVELMLRLSGCSMSDTTVPDEHHTIEDTGYRFPATRAFVEHALRRGWHRHIQVYVSRQGLPQLDLALATEDPNFGPGSMFPLLCVAKPLLAFAVVQACDRTGTELATPLADIAKHLDPQVHGARILDVLTHQMGVGHLPWSDAWLRRSWASCIEEACRVGSEDAAAKPAEFACYQEVRFWFILAELLSQLTHVSAPEALHEGTRDLLGRGAAGLSSEFAFGAKGNGSSEGAGSSGVAIDIRGPGCRGEDIQAGWRGGMTSFGSARAVAETMRGLQEQEPL